MRRKAHSMSPNGGTKDLDGTPFWDFIVKWF
jgi:hypothetical protein